MVPAVERAVGILQALVRADLRLIDVARELHLPKSTAFAILHTLRRHRFVSLDPRSGRFRLGPGLQALSAAVHTRADLREAAHAALVRLARATGETAILHVSADGGYLILDREESSRQLRVAAPLGLRLPPLAGAVAKAALAALPVDERRIPRRLPRFTAQSTTTRAAYLRDLRGTRQRGYSTDDEEYLPGVRAVSAPILDPAGRVLGMVSVVGVKARVSRARLTAFGRLVRTAAGDVSRTFAADAAPETRRAAHG